MTLMEKTQCALANRLLIKKNLIPLKETVDLNLTMAWKMKMHLYGDIHQLKINSGPISM